MPAGRTYTPIATQTLSTAVSSISFNQLPSSYTDLVLVVNGINATGGDALGIRFNGDTGTNYSNTRLLGDGSAASSNRNSNQTAINIGFTNSSSPSPNIISINNYSNSTTNKTAIGRSGNASNEAKAAVGLWRNTASINSITLINLSGYNFASGTTATLYGIAAA